MAPRTKSDPHGPSDPRYTYLTQSHDPSPLYWGTKALGVDVDPDATELARANFNALGGDSRIALLRADAREATPEREGPWDLVFLDADDPTAGKAVYSDLLQHYFPHLRPGGLLLAHDICVPKFEVQLAGYRDAVRNPAYFRATAPLEIDPCGVELSVKRNASATRASAPTEGATDSPAPSRN